MSAARLFRPALIAVLLWAAGSLGVAAQQQQQRQPPSNLYPQRAAPEPRNPLSELFRLLSPQPEPPPPPPPKPVVRKRPVAPAPPVVVSDKPAPPKADPSVFILVMGDTLGDGLAGGLTEAFEGNPDVLVLRRTRTDSGIVRDDFYDWRQAARDALASDKITHAVMMVGANDRQALRGSGGATLDVLSEAWRQEYGARVEAIVASFAERNIPFFWVGLPIMQNPRMSVDMLAINEIARTHVVKAGGTFVDIWQAFADSENRYTATGPALTGETVRLRVGDGIHFTRLGARKAAHFVEIEIKRLIENRPPAIIITLPSVDSEEPPVAGLEPGGIERLIDESARVGLGGSLPPISIPVKPVAGPIVPLNQPEVSRGAQLLTGGVVRASSEAGRLAEQVLVQGRAPEPKSGRGDDFRWPAPSP